MGITGSCHFIGARAIALFTRSRTELLTGTTFGTACTPRTPIAPSGLIVSVARSLARSIHMTYARFLFGQRHLHIARVGCVCATGESESFLQVIAVGGRAIRQPRCPRCHFLYFRTRVLVAFFKVHVASDALHAAVLWCWIVALALSEAETAATRGRTFFPRTPYAPIAIDRRQFDLRTWRQMLQKNVIFNFGNQNAVD